LTKHQDSKVASTAGEPELNWRRVWLSCGYLLVLTVLAFALWPLVSGRAMMIPYFDKFLHAFSFMVLMLWFSGLMSRYFYFRLFLILLILGALIEALQNFTPYRQMEFNDFVADALGLVAGWVLARAGMGNWCVWVEKRFNLS
jgi:VanZ family protein